jgi:putative heme-binding domain-containing protein
MRKRYIVYTMRFSVLFLTALPLFAQEGHGFTPADIERGGQMYLTNCVGCHGPDGDLVGGVNLASGRFRRASTDQALADLIRHGIPGTPMPPGNYSEEQTAVIVAYLHSMAASPKTVLSGANPGDPARGKAIVEGKGACLTCHRINGVGAFAGPDLNEIGGMRRGADLERSLLDPNAEIRADNRTVQATARDGKKITGRLLNQDTYTLQILNSDSKLASLSKAGLKDFEILKTSPMPGYKDKLTSQELADTVSYLASLKGRR